LRTKRIDGASKDHQGVVRGSDARRPGRREVQLIEPDVVIRQDEAR
jgi:hypothetical protein